MLQEVLLGNSMNLPVEVVHGKTGVTGDFVQTLAGAHSFLHYILVIEQFVF